MPSQPEAIGKIIFSRLSAAKRPLLIAHKNPDGDTLGAMMAVYCWLRDQGREAVAFCLDRPANLYGYLPRIVEITTDPAVFRDPAIDLVCVFDAGDLQFAGVADFIAAMPTKPFIANFDHHVTNARFGGENLVVADASSTAEVVHEFFRANDVVPSKPMANCLMTGILYDTSNFSNPITTVRCLGIASELLLKGISIQDITKRLLRSKPVEALKLWGLALERLRLDPATGIATTAVRQEDFKGTQVDDDQLDGLSNFLNRLLDAPVTLVFRELPGGKVKGSYRSADGTDVAAMAQTYGGGGHKKAAGFTVSGTLIESDKGWAVVQA